MNNIEQRGLWQNHGRCKEQTDFDLISAPEVSEVRQ